MKTTDKVPPMFFPARRSRQTDAVDVVALDWTKLVLDSRYHPPEGMLFTLHPRPTAHDLDRAQIRYAADDAIVTVAQTAYSFCVQLERKPPADGSNLQLDAVEQIARRLFSKAEDLSLDADQRQAFPVGGQAPRSAARIPAWLRSLRWRHVPSGVVFTCIKDPGFPTKAVLSLDPIFDGHWFSESAGAAL